MKFSKLMEKDKNSILVVDAMNLSFRWKHSGAEYFSEDFYTTVISLANSYKCNKIIITADHRGSWYRNKIFPEYKANRAKLRENQTKEEKEAFKMFIEEYEETLKFLEVQGLLVLRYEKTEADDIAAYITKILPEYKIWLISTDHDWDLLLNKNVNRWAYTTRKEFRYDNWYEHKDVSPEMYITQKCLMGDKGDNIPGVVQIGPKRAATIIEDYGDIFDIYDSLPINSHYKYIENLNNSKDILLLNHQLMDLLTFCNDALGEKACKDISTKVMEYIV